MQSVKCSSPTASQLTHQVHKHESISKAMTTQQAASCSGKTLIIWDWDDTLLPSSYLAYKGLDLWSKLLIDAKTQELLRELEEVVIKVLRLSISLGETHIVTNAAKHWVQKSSQVFLPRVYKEFFEKPTKGKSQVMVGAASSRSKGEVSKQLRLNVLSAREKFQKQLPKGHQQWKLHAFQSLANKMDCSSVTNIVVLGDSHYEVNAGIHFQSRFPHSVLKTVKLCQTPSIGELIRQIETITAKFDYILNHQSNVIIKLQPTLPQPLPAEAERCAQSIRENQAEDKVIEKC
ncbi:hypothetical protein FGO68_gene3070 [Halteria grandinella]|uniref:Uncharacterized protein n=1 Tax=Halteria grandinella TaxID=5974 RepID=A0A8J8NXQ8_HALGN|nr:hypothetical protein FGO68_gene3070 [Halteria grandinella]